MALAGKILIILMAIDIGLFFGGFTGNELLYTNSTLYNVVYNVDPVTNQSTGGFNASGNWSETLIPNQGSFLTQLGTLFTLPLFLIVDFMRLVFAFLFAPSAFLTAIGAPTEIIIFVGILLTTLYAIAFVSVIRGGEL